MSSSKDGTVSLPSSEESSSANNTKVPVRGTRKPSGGRRSGSGEESSSASSSSSGAARRKAKKEQQGKKASGEKAIKEGPMTKVHSAAREIRAPLSGILLLSYYNANKIVQCMCADLILLA